jgi:ATP-dependent RNA helicase DeaD
MQPSQNVESPAADAPEPEPIPTDAAEGSVEDEQDPSTSEAERGEGFAALGLPAELVESVSALGYEEPTPIQREAIPVLLAGRDLLGQAATGTGKTAAFALPLLARLGDSPAEPQRPGALVLVPTRELATQVAEAIYRYGKRLGTSVLPIYGGTGYGRQLRALSEGVKVVVATPGRVLDHLQRGTLELDRLAFLVLDEADEMLDMGFAEDLEAILSRAPAERQTALFSATLPRRILDLAEAHLRDPERIAIAKERTAPGAIPRVRQVAYLVRRHEKLEALSRVLDLEVPAATLVFCRTRVGVDEVSEAMGARGYRAEALHGGISQDQRERVLNRFREGRTELLVATDVAARGLDIDHVSHVVNMDVPIDPDTYVHRIGRTGRAGREGNAITFLEPRERRMLATIERVASASVPIEELPSAAELVRHRRERTREALLTGLSQGDGAAFRETAEELVGSHVAVDLLATAMALIYRAEHGEAVPGDDATRAPQQDPAARVGREPRAPGSDAPARPERRPMAAWGEDDARPPAPRRERSFESRPERGPDRSFDRGPDRGPGSRLAPPPPGAARLFIGAGRDLGLRPGDLVGAITGETGLRGDVVGPIRISERFTLVEVLEEHAGEIVDALRRAKVRGRTLNVRFDREI